jgi:hypothetical protein
MRQHVMTNTLAYSALLTQTKEFYNFLMPASHFIKIARNALTLMTNPLAYSALLTQTKEFYNFFNAS